MIHSAFCWAFGLNNLRNDLLRLKKEGDWDGVEF